MTSTTSILELRQADSNLVNSNGDYETLLANDIILNNGDILALKSAFIDTKPEGNIILETDTVLTIQFMPYITDWLETGDKQNYYNRNNHEALLSMTVNGLDFVPYYYTEGSALEGYETVLSVSYIYTQPPTPEPFLTTTYSYINIAGQTIIYHTEVFPTGSIIVDTLSNVIAKIGSFKLLTNTDIMMVEGFSYLLPNPISIDPEPPTIDTWNPYIYSTEVVIPAGNYSPSYLSLFISEKLSKNNNQDLQQFDGLIQSPFLKVASQYDSTKPMPNGALNPDGSPMIIGTEGTMYIATDNSLCFNIADAKNYFIGSSQVALEYDTDSNKMVWQFLHFPMYDNVSGTNISVRYQYFNNVDTNPIIATAKNGGVLLTSLTAVDTNGNQVNFWDKVLGFSLTKICVNSHGGYLTDILGLNGYVQTLGQTQHGLNMTTGFYGMDTVVIKEKTKWYEVQELSSSDDNTLCSTINNTVALEASNTIDELLNKYSHYIIQSDIIFRNSFNGVDSYHNMNGIISKYYSDNNYTFGDSEGAIEYIHNGSPVQIKSVKVRILSSDKTIDPDLGPDNTCYFQVIKQAQNIKK